MTATPFRRRLGLVAATAVIAGGFGVARHATASPAEPVAPAIEPAAVTVDDDYWACLALDYVDVGMCLENPLPDLSQYPTVPDMLDDLLSDLPR